MREDEIMLALERCASRDSRHCIRCPLFGDTWCRETLSKNVLLLIEKKNKEIERLKER